MICHNAEYRADKKSCYDIERDKRLFYKLCEKTAYSGKNYDHTYIIKKSFHLCTSLQRILDLVFIYLMILSDVCWVMTYVTTLKIQLVLLNFGGVYEKRRSKKRIL
jgi:hypothetical protein